MTKSKPKQVAAKKKAAKSEATKASPNWLARVRVWAGNNPYFVACLAIVAYLFVFRFNFVFNGDAWAESFAEYLDEALRLGWGEVIAQNWAGYLTIIPSFFTKLYVSLGLPIGMADYYFRGVVLIFTVLSAALIAAPFNRTLIRHDGLRILLAVCVVAILGDLASFSFINVWYIGLVPIIMYCLNPAKLNPKTDVAMGVYGALIALTKPFIILLPLIIYRMVCTRQWLGSGILLAAAALQSYQIIFNDKRGVVGNSDFELPIAVGGVFTGSTTAVFKLFHAVPPAFWTLAIVGIVLSALLVLLWRAKGFWIMAGIALVFAFSVYTYVLSPDGAVYVGLESFREVAAYTFKSQREILINASLLLALFCIADWLIQKQRVWQVGNLKIAKNWLIIAVGILLLAGITRPVDTASAGVTNNPLDAFRHQLNQGQPTCAPLAPSTLFFAGANWAFSYKGTCATITHDLNLFQSNFKNMNKQLDGASFTYDAYYFRLDNAKLQAIVVPVVNNTGDTAELTLRLTNSQHTFKATVEAGGKDEIQLATFNVSGLKPQEFYRFKLNAQENVQGAVFAGIMGAGQPVTYPYFLKP